VRKNNDVCILCTMRVVDLTMSLILSIHV
jgi:hypothetical protein